jgi:hypothetical protein
VSEQEARFVLTAQLAKSQLLYSVETPTSLTYLFTGSRDPRSASTDVTVDTPNGEAMWNMEFKARGISAYRKKRLTMKKDIEKLLCEPRPAYWFHTFHGVNRSTITELWQALLADFQGVAQRLPEGKVIAKPLVFHACCVRQRFSVEQRISIDPSCRSVGIVPDIPSPTYLVTRHEVIRFEERDGWRSRRYDTD